MNGTNKMNPLDKILGGAWKTCAHLIPAYGRSYATKEELLQAWEAGADFQIVAGPYCSIRDMELMQENHRGVMLHDLRSHINALVWGEE